MSRTRNARHLQPVPDAGIIADLYLRLSDARTEEALSGREEKLRAKATELGWQVGRVVVENDLAASAGGRSSASAFKRKKIKTPDGRTQLRTVRPGFRSILNDLADGTATALLCEDLDRIMRQPRDGEDLLDAVEMSGATCRSLSGSLTLTAGGTDTERFTARILVSVANKSSADTSRRVSDARERLANSSWGGGRRPYGFTPDPDAPQYHKRLFVVEEEAEVIRKAYAGILDLKLSLKAIVRQLRTDGAPTVTGVAWTPETLRDVLTKSSLPGLIDDQGRTVIPEIIPRDRYDQMVSFLADPDRRKNTANGNEPRWLVSGIAACGVCQGPIRCAGGADRRAYTCTNHGHVRRNASAVDELVANWAVWRLSQDDAADLLRPVPRPGVDVAALRSEARKLSERKSGLARMFAETGDEKALASGLKIIRDRLAVVESQLAASDETDPLPEFREGTPAQQVWAGMSLPRKRGVVKVLMDVTINPTNRRRGFDPESVEVSFDKSQSQSLA